MVSGNKKLGRDPGAESNRRYADIRPGP